MIKFMQVNKLSKPDKGYIAVQLDRETSYIKRIYLDDMTLDEIVGSSTSLSFNCLPKFFRIQEVPLNAELFAFV